MLLQKTLGNPLRLTNLEDKAILNHPIVLLESCKVLRLWVADCYQCEPQPHKASHGDAFVARCRFSPSVGVSLLRPCDGLIVHVFGAGRDANAKSQGQKPARKRLVFGGCRLEVMFLDLFKSWGFNARFH